MPLLPLPAETPPVDSFNENRVYLQTADFGPPPPPFDQAYFRRVLDRIEAPAYIRGLETGGGMEALEGIAAVFARISLAESRWDEGTIVGYASLGQRAVGWVYLWRETAAAGAVTVKKGTVVGTPDQRRFFTKEDVPFGPTDLGPLPVQIESTLKGYEFNVGGEVVTPLGEIVPGEISEIYVLLEDPDFGDPSIKVRNVAPTEGGADPQLEQLAADRGVSPKHQEETVDAFRLRIKSIVDGVTPAGIERTGKNLLRRWSPNLQFAIIDSWDYRYQTAYDFILPPPPNFPTTTFVYDDPRPAGPYNRMLSYEGANGGEFIAAMSYLPCLQEQGFFLHDPAVSPAELLTPGTDGGRRAASYLSLPQVLPPELLPCGWGARDAAADGVYASIWKMLNDLRAGGVTVQMILVGEGVETA